MKRFQAFGKRIFRLILDKEVFFNASAITFNLLLCAIPFTLILISIVGYLLSFEQAYTELLRYGQELLPRIIYEGEQATSELAGPSSLEGLIKPLVQNRRIYGIVGLSVLIFVSLGLFSTVKHVIFHIFDIEDRKHPALEWLYSFLAIGVVGGVFVFFSMAISVISLIPLNDIALSLGQLEIQFNWLYELINILLPILFTFLLFYAIFRYLSERRIPRPVSVLAAGVYTTMFEIAKIIISSYLDRTFEIYQYFYQGYSLLMLIGIWAFYSALLLVISAIIARSYQDIYFSRSHRKTNPYEQLS